ncbi:hypothetical protein J6590_060842 [Homalodisca vitripennis]|nr:hypothetical protein J6590_060842 [Homalodisca vitripennis]
MYPHLIFSFVTDCVMVTSEEGHFYYKTTVAPDTPACGIFLITDPDKIVEVYFDYLDVPCNTGGLVSFVDGWEMNGQFFPSVEDHPKPLAQRFHEFCGSQLPKQVFLSTQNAALIQYHVPKRGRGFSFHVRYISNPTPCNILIEGTSDVYTLRNYGKHVNCSLTAVYPAQVRVLQLGVGMSFSNRNMEMETGTIHKRYRGVQKRCVLTLALSDIETLGSKSVRGQKRCVLTLALSDIETLGSKSVSQHYSIL